jgi:hypothetical protein
MKRYVFNGDAICVRDSSGIGDAICVEANAAMCREVPE